jgi:hypothetical protein
VLRIKIKGDPADCEGEVSRWLVIRVREAKLAVKWHFELNPHTLIRLADHAVPADLVLAGFQLLFEISVISNRAGYHDWFVAAQKLYSHLPSSPTHHVVEPVCVSFVRGLHSPRCVLHKQNSVTSYSRRRSTLRLAAAHTCVRLSRWWVTAIIRDVPLTCVEGHCL